MPSQSKFLQLSYKPLKVAFYNGNADTSLTRAARRVPYAIKIKVNHKAVKV